MKLYIKEKVFSWTDRFTVWDEAGEQRYQVEGELFSWGKKLHVYDAPGAEAAFIQQKVFSWMPRYFVFVKGEQMAEIVRKFSFLIPKYEIHGPDWYVEGSFWEHDYIVWDSHGASVVSIHKQWMTWGDCYEMEIAEPAQEIAALATVLAIDCAVEDSNHH